jgi:YHS domain-containing protein
VIGRALIGAARCAIFARRGAVAGQAMTTLTARRRSAGERHETTSWRVTMKLLARTHPVGFLRGLMVVAFALLLAVAIDAPPASAGDVVNSSFFSGVAIKGYDPVAYFTMGRPVEGSRDYEYQWMGATWRFASAENRDVFAADPAKYAPQYGGYCAYAVSQGATADIDPAAWHIEGGKLYLNLSPQVQSIWLKDIPGYIAKADANWPKIKAGLAG